MKKFIRKLAVVEAKQFDMSGEYKILHGDWVSYKAGDWLVKANGKSWIVEGDVFDLLYEPIDEDLEVTPIPTPNDMQFLMTVIYMEKYKEKQLIRFNNLLTKQNQTESDLDEIKAFKTLIGMGLL